jgi:alpha-mannosidase
VTGDTPSKPLQVLVVSHTHWDREWYHSAAVFRQRLVALVDALLADASGETTPFLLDGQAIVLEDYLALRPEQSAKVASLLRSGSLEAGPWYVLADGLIPSGEAIVRNLLTGRRVLRRLGADIVAPRVAYCPDTFGHPGAVPAIAAGFGFPVAIVWRGYGGVGAPAGDTAHWHGADGSSVLLYHLPPDGYETGSSLPPDVSAMRAWWTRVGPLLKARSSTGIALLPNGADHHALQEDLTSAIAAMRRAASNDADGAVQIERVSLSTFAASLQRVASEMSLPVVTGELRNSYGYTWTLGGTFGTRAHQKRANALAERKLLRDVEPMLTLAWLHAREVDRWVASNARLTLAQMPAVLDGAWRTLLSAHPHDTLCGCSIDEVAQSMDERLRSTMSQGDAIVKTATEIALHHDSAAARSRGLSRNPSVVIRNRVARSRGGVAHLVLHETIADVSVGPGSARETTGASRDHLLPASASPRLYFLGPSAQKQLDATPGAPLGHPRIRGLTLQNVGAVPLYERRESPQHYPDNDLVRAHRTLAWVPPVPPLGMSIRPFDFGPVDAYDEYTLGAIDEFGSGVPAAESVEPPSVALAEHRADDIRISNGILTVHVSVRGISITREGRTLRNALTFETAHDAGDSYTPSIRGPVERLEINDVHVASSGPLRAGALVRYSQPESEGIGSVEFGVLLWLDAASDVVKFELQGQNARENFRLRAVYQTDVAAKNGDATDDVEIWADAAFGPVSRKPLNIPAEAQTLETVPPTTPMHRWIAMCTQTHGATLHADGLAEVEADATTGAIALTLIRAIGELSRNDLPERPGHAGWPARIPLAQCPGPFSAQFALQLHGSWNQQTRDTIESASDDFLLPLVGATMRDLERTAVDVAGPQLEGTALRFSTASLADDGDGIVLRCYNDSQESQRGRWTIPIEHFVSSGELVASVPAFGASAHETYQFAEARLDETLLSEWAPLGNAIEFTAGPRAIVTFRVRRAGGPRATTAHHPPA